MKKGIFIFTFIIALVIAGFFIATKSIQAPSNVLSETDTLPSPSSMWPQSTVIDAKGVPIRISWALASPQEVELYSNLKNQQLSEQIKVDKSCRILVNGGFYSKENTHLGLFVSDFEILSSSIQSSLFNGFIWINADNKVKIATDLTDNTPRLALQSGPLLMLNNQTMNLAIRDDEPARRVVAGITDNNKLIFLVLYKEQSELEGPLLGQLPEIINSFKTQTNIDIVDAINLDGGSASVFVSQYDLLREITRIGSYFCAK